MNSLKRCDVTYKLNKLPVLTNRHFKYNNLKGFTGSIVRRKVKGPIKIYWHYAFIYGFDKYKNLLLIENNDDGVECITWRDFLINPKDHWEFFHIEVNPNNFDKILKRAKERAKHPYNPTKNNCEHFVNYCLFEKLESIQVENTKLGANAFLMYLEMRLINTPSKSVLAMLNQLNEMRQLLDLNRGNDALDKIVKSKISNADIKQKDILPKPSIIKIQKTTDK